jgi:hypothetical protein
MDGYLPPGMKLSTYHVNPTVFKGYFKRMFIGNILSIPEADKKQDNNILKLSDQATHLAEMQDGPPKKKDPNLLEIRIQNEMTDLIHVL